MFRLALQRYMLASYGWNHVNRALPGPVAGCVATAEISLLACDNTPGRTTSVREICFWSPDNNLNKIQCNPLDYFESTILVEIAKRSSTFSDVCCGRAQFHRVCMKVAQKFVINFLLIYSKVVLSLKCFRFSTFYPFRKKFTSSRTFSFN